MPELCMIDNCDRQQNSRGWCKLHYERNRRHGSPHLAQAAHKPCAVEGCQKPGRSKTARICSMHYHRVYRYGSINPVHEPTFEDVRGRRYGSLVPLRRVGDKWHCQCDCGNTRRASAGELNRTDQRNTCGDKAAHRREYATYPAAHARLRADRGPAKAHPCVGCGGQAAHWSYNHDDPGEMYFDDPSSGCTLAYSVKQGSYSARCATCHKRFDMSKANATVL